MTMPSSAETKQPSTTKPVGDDIPFEPVGLTQEELNTQHIWDGIRFPPAIRPETLAALKTYELREDDILIVTFPKSGTHWMSEIVGLLLANGVGEKVNRSTTACHIEFSVFDITDDTPSQASVNYFNMYKVLAKAASPRLMTTHLRFGFLPDQLLTKRPKVIYVARNPKDAFASFYHFCKDDFRFKNDTWEDYFTGAITGDFPFGSWFDHVLEWWELSKKEDNVLFMKYEDMKKDHRDAVVKVAKHLNLSPDDAMIDSVVRQSSVAEMKKTYTRLKTDTNLGSLGKFHGKAYGANSYVRKGIVGDWKNMFTVAQNEEFDKVYNDKMAGSGLSFPLE